MAKDTEKLIRQLSLISFLMANRRPVSALEIKREVEGYSSMNEDAFARRFYADRAELESLGISLQVDKPAEGFFEAELYALPPENYYLRPIEFADSELAALRTALSLLDGEFAYAEPLRLALQQVSWGRPNPHIEEDESPIDVKLSASAGGRELSQRLAKIETAISRRKTIEFSYYSLQRDETSDRKVNPYHLVFRDGQFYLIGYSHERDEVRVFRLSRIRAKVSYATKAEHDFSPPEDFDRRDYAHRSDWQMGKIRGRAAIFLKERISWLVERDFGKYGEFRKPKKADGVKGRGMVFETDYASERQLLSWVLSYRENAQLLEPSELAEEATERRALLKDRHEDEFAVAKTVRRPLSEGGPRARSSNGRSESVIRPERFARLVTLAGLLIGAAREPEGSLPTKQALEELNISLDELREDLDVLNVVNFGGGTYVLYAEIVGDRIEVDPDTYGDNFARPARLLPLEAKALVAAIDLFGDHLPQTGLLTARKKIVDALGHDPSHEGLEIAPGARRLRGRADGQRLDPPPAPARDQVLQGERGRVLEARGRALPARQRARGLVPRLLRPRPPRHPPLPPRPDEGGGDDRDRVRAARGRRGAARRAGVARPRRGRDRRRRPRLGLARPGPVAARGAHRRRGALRRRRRRRASLRLVGLARPRGPQGRRRPRRPRARGRPRGRPQGRRGLSAAGCGRERARARPARDHPASAPRTRAR